MLVKRIPEPKSICIFYKAKGVFHKMKNLKKKIMYLGLCFLLFTIGGNIYTDADTAKAEMTVYVTPTGTKYHTHKCGNGTYTPTSLSNAQARGLTPCKKCFGNSTPSSSNSTGSKKKVVTKPIKINKTGILLVKGQTYKLKISNANGKVLWSSSKQSVATVSGSGKVTARGKGKAVITAKVGTKKKICKITVEAPKLSKTSLTMKIGESKKITLSGCRHSVKWSSSDPDIARVSKGKIKAVDVGSVTIKATTHGKKYSCKVKVNKPDVKSIKLSKESIVMECDSEEEMEVFITPKNAIDYYDIKAVSSNNKVVSVDSDNYGTIYLSTYELEGEADITITIGNVRKVCHVKVNKPSIKNVVLAYKDLDMEEGEEWSNWYSITPYNAGDYYEAVWKSENEEIAKVYNVDGENVRIVATGVGETNIILTIGDKSVICHVVVKEKMKSM